MASLLKATAFLLPASHRLSPLRAFSVPASRKDGEGARAQGKGLNAKGGDRWQLHQSL